MKIRILLISISIILLSVSCQKELEIELPEIEKKLVVNCFFSPDSLFKVRVGKLLSINDSTSSYIIEDANCDIFENGVFAEKLQYTSNGFYISETLMPKLGSIYTLEVKHPNFPNILATDTVPFPINILEEYFVHTTLYSPLDESYFHDINIRFQDNPLKRNYYELSLQVKQQENNPYNLTFEKSNDLVLQSTGLIGLYPRAIVFSDKLFNGQSYFLSTYYMLNSSGTINNEVFYNSYDLIVHFNAISYQFHEYTRYLIMHLINQESDIFEGIGDPIQMYSNIENGYGIFAAYCPRTDTLHHEFSFDNK